MSGVLYSCPWFEVVLIEDEPEPKVLRRFYGVQSGDWVLVARIADGRLPFVKLRRPIGDAEYLETLFVEEAELHRLVRTGQLPGAGHLAAYALAVARGHLAALATPGD